METRKERGARAIQKFLAERDVQGLLKMIEGEPCACLGARDGEPHCVCLMNGAQARRAVSYAALKRGEIKRLQTNELP